MKDLSAGKEEAFNFTELRIRISQNAEQVKV
jgi:hypothetical protein